MQTAFLIGAIVIAVGFLVILFIKEVPLRKVSGLEACAAEASGPVPHREPEPEPVGAGAVAGRPRRRRWKRSP
jgi:hypothetical protein